MPTVTLTVHLPGVELADEGATLANGRVTALPFESWQRLDPSFEGAQRSFERSRPVFWVGPIQVEDADQDALLDAASEAMGQVHDAFLLDPAVPWLPSPAISVHYLQFEPAGPFAAYLEQVLRVLGPMEREWIVFGSSIRHAYDAPRLSVVQRQWELLEKARAVANLGPARAALATLERTARPDSWWGTVHGSSVNELLQCVAACESELLGDDSTATLTDAFARHAAALTATTEAEVAGHRSLWERVYRLRSDLIHGRLGLHELDEERAGLLPLPRRLLRDIAEALLRLAPAGVLSREPLSALLARACEAPAEREALRRLIGRNDL